MYGHDVLEKLHEQHGVRHTDVAQQQEIVGETGIVGSVFLLHHPKRNGAVSPLKLIASLPVLPTDELRSQAHHLKFAQPRARQQIERRMDRPLYPLHHRALHGGDSETWWEEHAVDAKGDAQRLW